MKVSIALALIITAVSGMALVAGNVTYAWWLTISYEPQDSSVLGIPVSELSRDWASAGELNDEAVPPEHLTDFKKLQSEYGVRFSNTGDLNRDGYIEKVVVGVFRDKQARGGTFLLVVREVKGKAWKKVFLAQKQDRAGFSILSGPPDELYWYHCLECDYGDKLVWREGAFALEPFDCCD